MAIQRTTGGESLAPAGGLPPAPVDYVDAEYSEVRGRHLRDYARILYKYRWLAATSFCATLGLTLLVTLLTPRLYSATTRLQLAREAPIQLQLKDSVVNLDDPDH